MERKYVLADLNLASYHLKCAVDMLNAVLEAIEYGPNVAESYKDALYGVYNSLFDISSDIQDCTDILFAQKREETEVNA